MGRNIEESGGTSDFFHHLLVLPSVTSPLPQSKLDLIDGIHTLFAVTTQQWYESLKTYIEDQNLYKKISENGYKLVKENFCVDQASIKLIEIFTLFYNFYFFPFFSPFG